MNPRHKTVLTTKPGIKLGWTKDRHLSVTDIRTPPSKRYLFAHCRVEFSFYWSFACILLFPILCLMVYMCVFIHIYHIYVCVYCAYVWVLVYMHFSCSLFPFCCLLVCYILVCLSFLYAWVFFLREREKNNSMEFEEWKWRQDLEGDEGGETVIRIYYMKQNIFN